MSRPRPKGEVGVWLGVSRPRPRGVSAQGMSKPIHEGGVQTGRVPSPDLGYILACTDVDTPQQTATSAGGTHPTGMHSCFHVQADFGKKYAK